ncbi:MAG: enoyl-CoA hydratase [Gammaproteobacteria bacterium]|nr:MAG: enoyl-CoA hydratase [Gammaproteobacteria bacterium]
MSQHFETLNTEIIKDDYEFLDLYHEPETGILRYFMKPSPRPCFSMELLRDIRRLQESVSRLHRVRDRRRHHIRYLVADGSVPGVFNMGGDLNAYLGLIRSRDGDGLTQYARACIDVLYPNSINLQCPLTTISLVRGSALGGGFEAAISSNVVIAERSAQMGLPEILFNLFPGMGAYSFLSRRITPVQAERLILSGKLFTAAEMYEQGLVDVLAEDGEGETALHEYVRKQVRYGNGTAAVHAIRERLNPTTYDELLDISLLWVNAALRLTERDLRVMERLVKTQTRLSNNDAFGRPERREAQ